MPRKFRSKAAKKKDSNHRAALHKQEQKHHKQLEDILDVVSDTQRVISQLQEISNVPSNVPCTSRADSTRINESTPPTPSSSRHVVIQEDLRATLDQRHGSSQQDDIRHTLNSRQSNTSPHRQARRQLRTPPKGRVEEKRRRKD